MRNDLGMVKVGRLEVKFPFPQSVLVSFYHYHDHFFNLHTLVSLTVDPETPDWCQAVTEALWPWFLLLYVLHTFGTSGPVMAAISQQSMQNRRQSPLFTLIEWMKWISTREEIRKRKRKPSEPVTEYPWFSGVSPFFSPSALFSAICNFLSDILLPDLLLARKHDALS